MQNTEQEMAPLCFNVHRKTFGSFAVLYHHSVFRPMVEWLSNSSHMKPFDHIYPDLSRSGHIVRVAHPPIAIQDVSHMSQIDASRKFQHDMEMRASVHRWGDLKDYCDPKSGLPFRLQPK